MIKPKLTLIDGSSLIYSACYNMSSKDEKEDTLIHYKDALDYYVDSILKETNADYYIIFGDQPSSYRKRLFDTFKADRKNKPFMKFKADLTYYANEFLEFFNHSDLEADDLCLLAKNKFKEKYDVIIASKDSDLRQDEAMFFNYGKLGKKDYSKDIAFENIDKITSEFNLWKQVLQKGHNNKVDYLEGCGDGCSTNYLKQFKPDQYKFAVLKAYIYGIEKNENVKRNVKGYGLAKGIDKFNKSFKQTYLFRYDYELSNLRIELELPKLQNYENTKYDF